MVAGMISLIDVACSGARCTHSLFVGAASRGGGGQTTLHLPSPHRTFWREER